MFNKTQRGVSERPKQNKPSFIPKWLGSAVVIVLILGLMSAFMLWKPWAPVASHTDATASLPQTVPEETNQDYRFYDQLPKQKVTPIPEQAVPNTQPKPTGVIVQPNTKDKASSEITPAINQYFLQVKSFQDPDSADARRSEILMNKLPADVMTTTESGKTWYRVISGPYTSQEAALLAQQTLQNSGIDSIIVQN